jgi:hypothetical protein
MNATFFHTVLQEGPPTKCASLHNCEVPCLTNTASALSHQKSAAHH